MSRGVESQITHVLNADILKTSYLQVKANNLDKTR